MVKKDCFFNQKDTRFNVYGLKNGYTKPEGAVNLGYGWC